MPDDRTMRGTKPLLWREGYYAAGDELMNFINALDSGDMTGREVRSAIYGKCLEMHPKPDTAKQERG